MELREKTIQTEKIFQGRIIKVRVDEVSLPDGSRSTREIVEHSGAVAILAMDNENNVWMVEQYRKAVERELLEIPAGTLEEGEASLECAQRELAEETGFQADKWEKVLSYYSAPGFCNEQLHIFLARDLTPGETNLDEDEFLRIKKIPLKEAYDLIFAGQIQDGKSIIAIQYACQKLAQ